MAGLNSSGGIKILVIYDNSIVRAAFISMLQKSADFIVIGEAFDSDDVLHILPGVSPDVILLGIKISKVCNLNFVRRIKMLGCSARILAVTGHGDKLHPRHILSAGAMGYVAQDVHFDELAQAIRTVYCGRYYLTLDNAKELFGKGFFSEDVSPFAILSRRELQIAIWVLKGFKAKQIASQLAISSKTVNSYRYRIFSKLAINGDVELAFLAQKYRLIH